MKIILFWTLFFSCQLKAEELKVLTWNVFMLPKPIKFSHQNERTSFIVDHIAKSDYDVVFLQEAFMGSFHRKLRQKTSDVFPFQYYLGKKLISPTIFGSGVYVLSKYPIVETKRTYFKNCAVADCFASKGALFVTIQLPSGKKINFISTHMQAGQFPKRSRIRMKQLHQIRELIDQHHADEIPIVLLGDMNIDAKHEDFSKALEMLDMESLPLEGDLDVTSGFPTVCYKTILDGTKWVDHILTGKSQAIRVTDKKALALTRDIQNRQCPLSDHHAVQAVLSF